MAVIKPEYVSVREAFPHEAHNFTPWIEENIDALSNRLGFKLTVLEREKSVGSFNVDLFCEDEIGNKVIIENQIERTNHDHLGKLLTYMINLDATVAIWIATEVLPEHQRVLDHLNEVANKAMSFYFVQVEAVRDSMGAYIPIFNVFTRPDEQTREIGEQKKEWADRHQKRFEFWSALLQKMKSHTNLFSSISPKTSAYLSTSAGKPGTKYGFSIRMNDAAVWFEINYRNDVEANEAIFEQFITEKATIEQEIGLPIVFERQEDIPARHISLYIIGQGGLARPETWDDLQNVMADAMIRFNNSLHKRIQKIRV